MCIECSAPRSGVRFQHWDEECGPRVWGGVPKGGVVWPAPYPRTPFQMTELARVSATWRRDEGGFRERGACFSRTKSMQLSATPRLFHALVSVTQEGCGESQYHSCNHVEKMNIQPSMSLRRWYSNFTREVSHSWHVSAYQTLLTWRRLDPICSKR